MENITPQQKTLLQKFFALFSFKDEAETTAAPAAEVPAEPVAAAPTETVAPVAIVEETPEQLAAKLSALGYKVEKVEAPENIEAKLQAVEAKFQALEAELAKKNAQTVIAPVAKAEAKPSKTSVFFNKTVDLLRSQINK